MTKKRLKRKEMNYDEVLQHLMDDPTRSIVDIAQDLGSYRQRVWRDKKKLEEENIIWGYSAVVDELRLNHVSYMVFFKTKPMSKGMADILIQRIQQEEPKKENIRIIDLFYINGEFDLVETFTAPDHTSARKYFDKMRLLYEDYLLDKPLMFDINFALVLNGKRNPELKKLYDFVPD